MLKGGEAVMVASDSLAVDQAGAKTQAAHRLQDQRIARRPVVAVAGEQPDADRIAAGHQPIAVVLDFVNPVRPSREVGRQGRASKAR